MLTDGLDQVALRDRVLMLGSIPELQALDEDARALMAEDGRGRRFPPGAPLFSRDAPVDRVYYIAQGRVAVARAGQGAPVPIRGSTVGLLSLLAGESEGLEATAIDEVVALEIPAGAVLRNLQESFSITRSTVAYLAREFLARRGPLPTASPMAVTPVTPSRPLPMTTVEKLILLRRTPFGQLANLEAAVEVVTAMAEVRLDAGDLLWRIGDPPTHWVRIEHGEVVCSDPDGRSVTVGAGYLLGELDGWAGRPRSFEARAITPVVAQRMNLDAHVAILEAHPDTAMAMTRFLARVLLGT